MAAPKVGEEDITRLRGMTFFGIIKQMQHFSGVASMIVSPSELCHPRALPSDDKAPSGITIMLATPQFIRFVFVQCESTCIS